MRTTTKTVYLCDFCQKKLFIKQAMERHENICPHNPINEHPCYLCKHFEIEEGYNKEHRIEGGEYLGEYGAYTKWKCSKKGIYLHTRRAKQRGLVDTYPETFEGSEQMPNKCDLFNYNTY